MNSVRTFRTDAAIIARLGRQLVAKQETALIELVKNAYDADATEVEVVFENRGSVHASLEIQDNGLGMSRAELEDGFLLLASENKVSNPKSNLYRRPRAGRKGIGRFSTQRLGDRMVLSTFSEGEPHTLELTVDWTEFKPGRKLEEVPITIAELPPSLRGTRIRIEGLADGWSTSQIRACWRGVLALQQPFPVAPAIDPREDPGFKVRFLEDGSLYDDVVVVADMQSEVLNYLPVVVEMQVDGDGNASWRISKNAFGETRPWRAIHHSQRSSREPPPYGALRDVHMKAYHAILLGQNIGLPAVVQSRVREVMRNEGGIRLYRNGFRVTPYGEPEDDWLGLDEAYGQRNALAPIANRNWFGIIEVRDTEGKIFDEHTSREGLIDTPAFRELRELASAVLISAGSEIQSDRGRKVTTSSKSPDPEKSIALSEARKALREAREAADRAVHERKNDESVRIVAQNAARAEELISREVEVLETRRAQLADETAMLRLLSSIGMTTAEFSHETGMAFEAFRLDLDPIFDVALKAKPNDVAFATQADRAKKALIRLDTLTAYLNSAIASRATREIHPVSLSLAVEDFGRGLSAHALTQSTVIEIDTPPLDALHTEPMHEAEVASVLLNFHTNALKAMKRTSNSRKVLIVADRLENEGEVRLRFCDTGSGVREEIRDRIFDAFFTTQHAPTARAPDAAHAVGTGLGLWIVQQIVSNVGGRVFVGEPPAGYSTCMEVRFPAENK
ncbi:ATP-binding protein [Rhizobium leguminosarum]|uniref:ATP-binding protein n=1 Tax=Rhizobium leguminosarum TaxID=384 RepID=UPI003F97860E